MASRSARLPTVRSWMRTAAYPSKCGMVKKPALPLGQHRLLLVQVGRPHREDRTRGRLLVAEAAEVGLAERPIPGEGLAVHEPGAVAVALRLGDVRQVRHQASDVIDRRHRAPFGR